jgi:hypothetical protein
MRIRIFSMVVCPLIACLGALVASPAHAAPVTLSFSGTYDIQGTTIFGLSGPAVPYYFEITYDPALDTNASFIATGDPIGGATTTHDWYGYSASGIVATSLTFGTQTWTAADLIPQSAGGFAADLWFDTDISLSAPTRSWLFFQDSDGSLTLGVGAADASNVFLRQVSTISAANGAAQAPMVIGPATPVPEPSTLALLAVGLLGAARRTALGQSRRTARYRAAILRGTDRR